MQRDTLGFYLDVARAIQKLKQTRRTARIDAEGDESFMATLWRLQRLLGDSANDPSIAGLRPFSGLRPFRDALRHFYQELNESVSDDESSAQAATLGDERRRQLQDLIEDFERVFHAEVESRIVFISPDRPDLLVLASLDEFLHTDSDMESFRCLPRIAQKNFEDAGKCLVYGLSGAAISMSLQAVEATIRFYYMRHGGPGKPRSPDELPEWGGMLRWLDGQQPALLPGNATERRHCYDALDILRQKYRNTVAHGRALLETSNSEESIARGEEIFRECWRQARTLIAETPRRNQLKLRIRVSGQMDFDTALATYLYSWNPELPPFGINHVEFDSSLTTDVLMDTTILSTNHWPNLVQAQGSDSLSRSILRCFRMQPNYAATIDPLVEYVDQQRQGNIVSRFNRKNPREDDVDILDLYAGIQHHVQHDPQLVLTETWQMLDKFVNSSLPPNGQSLVTDLNMQSVFRTLCTTVDELATTNSTQV